jgi:hypothetical protein
MATTLADIERATARRVGPYYQSFLDRQVPSTASFETLLLPALRSTVEQDLVTNLWLLRRGVDWQGASVTVDPIDRQRLVAIYDAARGAVTVDRPYSVAPASGEVVEFHHLDPEHELREVVRAGLRRCLFEDRFQLGAGYIYEADLTSVLPWLDDVNMVKRIQVAPYPSGFPGPSGGPCDIPFEVFGQAGHVWVRVSGADGAPFYGGLFLIVHRPHFSWVNQTDTVGGPTQDADILEVDVEYAAAAAHIEAWHVLPAKMQAAAAGNLQATREQAAYEYTRQSYVHRLPRHDRMEFNRLFSSVGWRPVVINA